MKRIFYYALIIFLLFMLFLPPVLRSYGKDLYHEIQISKSKDKVMVLNCSSLNEKINTSYLNDKTYNFQYQIEGNYTNLDNEEIKLNAIQEKIKNYAKITYHQENNSTDYRIDFNMLNVIPNGIQDYNKNINEQQNFYTALGYTCTINGY